MSVEKQQQGTEPTKEDQAGFAFNPAEELGVSGLRWERGVPAAQALRMLKGDKAVKTWREMSRYDAVIRQSLLAYEMLVRRVEWRVEAGEPGNPKSEEIAEFVDGAREDMSHSWGSMIGEVMSYLAYGWSFSELVYKQRRGPRPESPGEGSRFRDGRWGWRKIVGRSQDSRASWIRDDSGGVGGMVQRDPATRQLLPIPIQKALLFRTTTEAQNPEGRSLLEGAFLDWYFKKQIREIEAIGVERDLAGLPVAFVPPGLLAANATSADTALLNSLKEMIVNIRRDEQEGVIFPMLFDENGNQLYDLKLLASAGSRQFDINKIQVRYDTRIAGTLMSDFIMLGHGESGSRALSEDKTDLFEVALEGVADNIAEVFNRHAIPRLLALNGLDPTEPPILQHGPVERVDPEKLVKAILGMAQAGFAIAPDDELENALRTQLHLPEKPEPEDEGAGLEVSEE